MIKYSIDILEFHINYQKTKNQKLFRRGVFWLILKIILIHPASNLDWIHIKICYFECTSIWTSIIKRLWKAKKMVKVKVIGQRYFVIYKRSPLKMQKIIKPRSSSRQLLETVNFAFMKIFDFLVKIAVFRASLLFLGDSRHALRP